MNLETAAKMLCEVGIDECEFEVRLLAERFLKIPMSQSLFRKKEELSEMSGFGDFSAALEERINRRPLQYILGEWEFYGLTFKVNENCLIPRPDTELIVESAVKHLNKLKNKEKYTCLDLCTGSGCIAAAVMSRVKNAHFTLVDISASALEIARENITALGFSDRTDFICADAMSEIFSSGTKFDLVCANPPYIRESDMPSLEKELFFEPRIALTDGGDGLSFYRAIVELYKNSLAEDGATVFEHGYDQFPDVKSIALENGMTAQVIKDYGGRDRGAFLKNDSSVT